LDDILTEDYYFSSARNYAGLENEIEIVFIKLLLKLIVGTDCKSALSGLKEYVLKVELE
jgi:hypothetical protein